MSTTDIDHSDLNASDYEPWTPEVGRLHYPGDVVDAVLADPIKGPTATGERVTAYDVTYDPATDRTTALFRYTTTDDVEANQ